MLLDLEGRFVDIADVETSICPFNEDAATAPQVPRDIINDPGTDANSPMMDAPVDEAPLLTPAVVTASSEDVPLSFEERSGRERRPHPEDPARERRKRRAREGGMYGYDGELGEYGA